MVDTDWRTCPNCQGYYILRHAASNVPTDCDGCGVRRCSTCLSGTPKSPVDLRTYMVCRETKEACTLAAFKEQRGLPECVHCGVQAVCTWEFPKLPEYSFFLHCSEECAHAAEVVDALCN